MVVLAFGRAAIVEHGHRLHAWRTSHVFTQTQRRSPGCGNSLIVTLATVVVAVLVAAPAGYVLSRGRGRAVVGLLADALHRPVAAGDHLGHPAVRPVRQARPGRQPARARHHLRRRHDVGRDLDDGGLLRLDPDHAGGSGVDRRLLACSAASPGSCCATRCPASCRRRSSRSCWPGTTTWWRSCSCVRSTNFTLPIGLETFFQQNSTDWGSVMAVAVVMMVPPVIVFAFLNRFFSVGGIGGSLAGR